MLLILANTMLAPPALVAGATPSVRDAEDGRRWHLAATLGEGWIGDLAEVRLRAGSRGQVA
jgi:hypothetical protein